ncbi:uncharacterized protein LOC116608335 [Nematostella vectensis]|uniref:uncharacterized protein LOC116608335 n=1 Tax=Nematostella vectensis TaxID=45351 RepID=UPI0020772FDE|nr:uncharacterized protein LOC116608335 [Nematostella vectensis]
MPPRRSTRKPKHTTEPNLVAEVPAPPKKRTRAGRRTTEAEIIPATSTESATLVADIVRRVTAEVTQTVTSEVTRQLLPLIQQAQTAAIPDNPPVLPLEPLPAAIVEDSISSIQNALSGMEPNQSFLSIGVPIDHRVSVKLRSKIWNNEFIDFGLLIDSSVKADRFQITLSSVDESDRPSVCFEPTSKPKRIRSIDDWLSAFHVFVGVYLRKYPNEGPALMKYGDVIRDLAVRGQNWQLYDENFRSMRETRASAMPWDAIHSELWLRSQGNQTQRPTFKGAAKHVARHLSGMPKGVCYNFHRGAGCSGCDYKHTCYKCGASHPAFSCNFRPQNKFNRPQTAQSRTGTPNTSNTSKK